MRRRKDASRPQFVGLECRIGRQHGPAAQIDDAQARWADQTDAGARAGFPQALLPCESLRAGFGKSVGEHGRDLDADASAFLHSRHGSLGRCHNIGVIGRLRQRRQ